MFLFMVFFLQVQWYFFYISSLIVLIDSLGNYAMHTQQYVSFLKKTSCVGDVLKIALSITERFSDVELKHIRQGVVVVAIIMPIVICTSTFDMGGCVYRENFVQELQKQYAVC